MKEFYEYYWSKRGLSGPRPRYKIFADWIENSSSVFEIGCGDGYLGEYLKKNKNASYSGIDISQAAVNMATERGLKAEVFDIDQSPDFLKTVQCDYIIISEVIEHVINAEEIIKNSVMTARRGVLVSIPNIAYWKFRIQLLFGNFPKQWAISPREHLRFWSVDDFYKMINNLGFKVRDIKASNGRKPFKDWWSNLFGLQVCFFITKISGK